MKENVLADDAQWTLRPVRNLSSFKDPRAERLRETVVQAPHVNAGFRIEVDALGGGVPGNALPQASVYFHVGPAQDFHSPERKDTLICEFEGPFMDGHVFMDAIAYVVSTTVVPRSRI